jgi:hypothetical protein
MVVVNHMNLVFETVALGFSLAAIVISITSARHQALEARRSHLLSFMAEFGGRSRTREFRVAQEYIRTKLERISPEHGIYDLPEPAREHVLLVGYFYQDIGALVVTGVLNEDFALALYYTGIKETWDILEPYIRSERENLARRGAGSIFGSFEHIAVYAHSVSAEQVRRKFLRRQFPVPAQASLEHPAADGLVTGEPEVAGGDLG